MSNALDDILEAGRQLVHHIDGRDCTIEIAARPAYCNRGNFIATIECQNPRRLSLDGADGWPRYYFDLERAKLEVQAWMRKRGQWLHAQARWHQKPTRSIDHARTQGPR